MNKEVSHDRCVGRFKALVARFIGCFTETFQRFTGRFGLAR